MPLPSLSAMSSAPYALAAISAAFTREASWSIPKASNWSSQGNTEEQPDLVPIISYKRHTNMFVELMLLPDLKKYQ